MRTGLWLIAALGGLASALIGQIANLSTNGNGSDVYFTGTMSPPGVAPSATQKVLMLRGGVLSIVRESTSNNPLTRPTDYRFGRVELDRAGTTRAIQKSPNCNGGSGCTINPEPSTVTVETPSRTFTFTGFAQLTQNGRYAYIPTGATMARVDLASGDQATIGPVPQGGVHVIAEDGTAVIVRPGGLRLTGAGKDMDFTISTGMARGVLAGDGSRLVYQAYTGAYYGPIRAVEIATNQERAIAMGRLPMLADDGRTFSFIRDATGEDEIWMADAVTGAARRLLHASDGILDQTLSGDGSMVIAATGWGNLLAIDTTTGAVTVLMRGLGPGASFSGPPVPGSLVEMIGRYPSDFVPEILAGGRPVSGLRRTQGGFSFQIPWETPVDDSAQLEWYFQDPYSGERRLQGVQPIRAFSPVLIPVQIAGSGYAIHEDWSGAATNSQPARRGEVLHFFGTGYGAVDGAVATGEPTPLDRLYRIQQACDWQASNGVDAPVPIPVLFAGLAPGLIGIYQLDVAVPLEWPHSNFAFGCTALHISRTARVPVV